MISKVKDVYRKRRIEQLQALIAGEERLYQYCGLILHRAEKAMTEAVGDHEAARIIIDLEAELAVHDD